MAIKERDSHIDVLQGTLDMLILQTLQWGPQHGLALAQMIRSRSEDLLKIEAGSLYPRSIAWSSGNGCRLNGRRRTKGNAPSITG